jgi:hypothetical protein
VGRPSIRVSRGSPVAASIRRKHEFSRSVCRCYGGQSLREKKTAKLYTREQTRVLAKSRIQFASLRGYIRHIHPGPSVTEAQGQMSLLFRSLCILFPPRLPRLRPEDVAGTAEYHNRLARHHEATMNPAGMWTGRISTERTERVWLPFSLSSTARRSAKGIKQHVIAHPVWIDSPSLT